MFDVRPMTDAGEIDIEKIASVKSEINLSNQNKLNDAIPVNNVQNSNAFNTFSANLSASAINKKTNNVASTVKQSSNKPTYQKLSSKLENDLATFVKFTPSTISENDKQKYLQKKSKSLTAQLIANYDIADSKDLALRELEKWLDETKNPATMLKKYGAVLHDYKGQKTRAQVISSDFDSNKTNNNEVQLAYDNAINKFKVNLAVNDENDQIDEDVPLSIGDFSIEPDPKNNKIAKSATRNEEYLYSPAAQEIEHLLKDVREGRSPDPVPKAGQAGLVLSRKRKSKKIISFALAGFVFVLFSYLLVNKGESVVQASLEQNGASAVMNIQYAKENLEELNFSKAAESFSLAYDDFSSATSTLDKIGASFFSAIGSIPGFENR